MKLVVILAVACFAAVAQAQVFCRNPGSLLIPASPCCDQVLGQGLAGALGAFFDMMDLECKLNIFFDRIITDPDVTDFFNYITGPEFRVLILSIQNMPEFKYLMEYMCFEADLDGYLYLNTLGDILTIPRMPHPIGPHCHPEFPFPVPNKNTREYPMSYGKPHPKDVATPYNSGVRRLFDDLGAEIPSDDIYDMWLHKVANDPYLCPGYLKLSSPEFRTVAITVEYDPEFIRFVNKMEEWGIHMKQWIEDLKTFLWYSDYCR